MNSSNFLQFKFEVIGHRGCCAQPENTIPSFIEALNHGATGVEMDVIASKDEKIVVEHYDNLLENCVPPLDYEGPHRITRLNYDQIRLFESGLNTHKSTLDEIIEVIKKYNPYPELHPLPIKYLIELKCIRKTDVPEKPPTIERAKFANIVLQIVENYKIVKDTIFMSFDGRLIGELQKKLPPVNTCLLAMNWEEFNQKLKHCSRLPNYCAMNFRSVGLAGIEWCHSASMKLICWTVNNRKKAESLKEWGCDMIVTDYPALMSDLVEYVSFPESNPITQGQE